jgi:hypothetical protein
LIAGRCNLCHSYREGRPRVRSKVLAGAFVAALATASTLFAVAPITIVVIDPPGVGFNDTTSALPAPGNNGPTVGEQRLNAVRHAAAIWSSKLDSPVPIRVRVGFKPLPCTAESGVAGGAQPINVYPLVPLVGHVLSNVLYPASLANKLTGRVLDPNTEEIQAFFNSNLGQPECMAEMHWYYGLDAAPQTVDVDLTVLTLHELAHGLGFLPLLHQDGSRLGGYGISTASMSSIRAWENLGIR